MRLAAGLQGLTQNPLLSNRQLDSEYYVTWAREIAAGDFASARGIVADSPFILNPLYAYVLAPVVGRSADPTFAVIAFQALLAAATTAMAATAARRFFGLAAAWTAGLAVAFSTALVQLDAHVAVSGLAAFLMAGAVFSSSPAPEGASGRGHGPLARGLWLGLGALARPVTPLALPFFAWDVWKRAATRRAAAVAILLGAFAACALPSLLRNWSVAGEPILFTSASGINLEIGNNAESRRLRTMVSPYTNFEPRKMHEDARIYVMTLVGGDPTPSEVSGRFTRMAIDEFVREPVASVVFCAQKARWFWSPVEVPSSASLASDLRFTPILALAFVPTWLVAAVALAGVFVHRKRRDVMCGPGAIVLAHVVVLTMVFPISHYRSPAIPALAVLAGGAVHAALAAWRAGARRTTIAIAAGVAACAVVGALPPQPERGRHADAVLLAIDARDRGRLDDAVAYARESMRVFAEDLPGEPELATTWKLLGELEARRGRLGDALAAFDRAIELQPLDWRVWLMSSKAAQDAGDLPRAEAHARRAVHDYPLLGLAYARLGEVLLIEGRRAEAADAIRRALGMGVSVDAAILRALGIR